MHALQLITLQMISLDEIKFQHERVRKISQTACIAKYNKLSNPPNSARDDSAREKGVKTPSTYSTAFRGPKLACAIHQNPPNAQVNPTVPDYRHATESSSS
jgi:hypothetical protein